MVVLHPSLPLAAAAGLALPVAMFAPKALAALFALTVVAALAMHVFTHRAPPPIPARLGAALAAVLVLAAGSSLWSLTPDRTLWAAIPLAGLMLGIAVLLGIAHRFDDAARARIGTALLFGVAVGAGVLLIERTFDRALLRAGLSLLGWDRITAPYTLKPGATILALALWPCLPVLARRFSPAATAAAVAVLFAAILFSGSDAAALSAALGLGVFALARRWDRIMAPLLGTALAGLMIAAPWIPSLAPDPRVSMAGLERLSNSGIHRIIIWQTAAEHIRARPWLGHGFDTSRSLYPQETSSMIVLARPSSAKMAAFKAELIPLHPHNMALQIWLEMGAVGAMAVLAALLTVLVGLARAGLSRNERAVGYGFFVAALAIAATAYGAWQAWWLSALGLNAVFLVALFSYSRKTGQDVRDHG